MTNLPESIWANEGDQRVEYVRMTKLAEIDDHRRKVIAENERLLNALIESNRSIAALEAQLAVTKGKLNEIACWSQSQGFLWWQVKAREALSALESTPPAPKVTDDWLRDTAMDVMLATEVGEAVRILSVALESTLLTPKATEAMREFAAKQSSTDTDIRAALGSRSELYFAAPKVTEAGPVPTYECEFRVGQPVRLANPYAEDDPDRTFYVTGIDWEYRSVVSHGWNITVATAEEIARGYGATDGFTPSDLTAAQEAGKP